MTARQKVNEHLLKCDVCRVVYRDGDPVWDSKNGFERVWCEEGAELEAARKKAPKEPAVIA